ncbi:MAG TPA: hypothetical protein VJR49_03315, partial [Chthoniobacterales bacterium]|nr:hypothetical protein [Chthoniobacterales bacterium]
DTFAKRVWGRSWAKVFAADIQEEFTPNDFEMRPPGGFMALRRRRAIRKMKEFMRNILANRTLAVKAPWNEVAQRSGLVSPTLIIETLRLLDLVPY